MKLTFRNANIEDARLLFDWRNDPTTRLNSHSTAELVFDSHVSWLKATLDNSMRRLFITEQDGQPVGTVRVDQEADGSVELSWTVAPEARGRGIASRMVQLAVDEVLVSCSVRAEVKTGNEASIKVAKAAGMQVTKQDGEVLHFYRPSSAQRS